MDELKVKNILEDCDAGSGADFYEVLNHYPKAVIVTSLMYLNHRLADAIFTEEEKALDASSDNEVGSSMVERTLLLQIMNISFDEYRKKIDTAETDNIGIVH
jgi:hypothetical protein